MKGFRWWAEMPKKVKWLVGSLIFLELCVIVGATLDSCGIWEFPEMSKQAEGLIIVLLVLGWWGVCLVGISKTYKDD